MKEEIPCLPSLGLSCLLPSLKYFPFNSTNLSKKAPRSSSRKRRSWESNGNFDGWFTFLLPESSFDRSKQEDKRAIYIFQSKDKPQLWILQPSGQWSISKWSPYLPCLQNQLQPTKDVLRENYSYLFIWICSTVDLV